MRLISPAFLLTASLFLAPGVSRAEGLHDQRTWTGRNGKALEAKFESREGNLLVLTGQDGKTLKIDPTNLSDNDMKWLEAAEKEAAAPPPVPEPTAAKPAAPAPATAATPAPASPAPAAKAPKAPKAP